MRKYSLSADWIIENNNLIKQSYTIALQEHYNVTDVAQVLSVLYLIDPDNACEENAVILSKLLQMFEDRLDRKLGIVKDEKTKKEIN